jgi:hypothetical protein
MGLSSSFPSPSGHFLVVAECGDNDTTIGPTVFVITFDLCSVRVSVSFNNVSDVGDRSCFVVNNQKKVLTGKPSLIATG